MRGRIRVPVGRELGREVFSHVDGTGDRIAGNPSRENERDRVAAAAFGSRAAQLDLVALNRAEDIPHAVISPMRALDAIAVLFQIEGVAALAAEELDVDIPAAAQV